MRIARGAMVLALGICAMAGATTVDSLVAAVRGGLAKKQKDSHLADSLEKFTLTQRLEDRVIEALESEGAGPQTLGVLQSMRDASRLLPAPPDPPPGMEPPPPPTLDEEREVWQATAANSLDYTRSLPDFVCTETIHRWGDPTGRQAWREAPTITADLSFFDHKEEYKLLTVDGKPTRRGLWEVGGAVSQGEFGSMLGTIFNPRSQAEHRWDHWTTLRKRPTLVYFVRVAVSHQPQHVRFKTATGENLEVAAGLHGYIYVDRETNRVTRIREDAEDIPAGFPVQRSSEVLDYDYAAIGADRYLLPLRAEIRIDAGPRQNLNSAEFQKYRKFGANATVTFGEAPPPVKK